jgi:hypothetical protein
MTNVSIAKSILKRLTSRTERDLYMLKYGDGNFTPITEEALYLVREICNENSITCPLYKWSGEVKFKQAEKDFYLVLNLLATEYSLVFDLKKIQ